MDDLSRALSASVGATESDNDCLVIDNDLRSIAIPANRKIAGVENDDDVNVLPFIIPRYINGIDLSTFQIRINYLNALGIGNAYMVNETEVGSDTISFSWVIDRHAFAKRGDIRFVVCARLIGNGDVVEKEFNTTVHRLTVLEGLETVPSVPQEVKDSILEWLYENSGPIIIEWLNEHPNLVPTFVGPDTSYEDIGGGDYLIIADSEDNASSNEET